MQDADLDGLLRLGVGESGKAENKAGGGRQPAAAAQRRYIVKSIE